VQVIPRDADFELALVSDQAVSELLGVIPDVLSKALDDGDPDHVRGKYERAVLAESEVGRGEEWMKGDFLKAVRRVVATRLDRSVKKSVHRLVGLASR
jgi:hypothetical protein